jgi:hypothetical protein
MVEPTTMRILMRKVMAAALLVFAATAMAACKKGSGGGYIQSAPAPVSVAR